MKVLALSRIEHGYKNKDGQNAVLVANEGEVVDIPDDAAAKALIAAGAATTPEDAAKAADAKAAASKA